MVGHYARIWNYFEYRVVRRWIAWLIRTIIETSLTIRKMSSKSFKIIVIKI